MRGTEPPPKRGTLMVLETKGVREFSTVHTQQTKQRTEWSLPQKSDDWMVKTVRKSFCAEKYMVALPGVPEGYSTSKKQISSYSCL